MAPIGSSEVGGVESYTFRLAEAFIKRGHEVVLYGGTPRAGDCKISSVGIDLRLFPYLETHVVPDFGTRFQRLIQRIHFAWRTRKHFLKESFDAVLIFKPYDFMTAWFWRQQGLRSRIVASLHGTEFYFGDRFFSKSIDSIYAVSHSTAQLLEKRYDHSCEIVPNFLDGQRFVFLDRPFPPQEKVILSVGRMVKMKGMAGLMRVFARVHSKIPEARLVLVGDGPERSKLEELARQLDLMETIEMPGILSESEVIEYHRKCWVYVQPSIGDESFSISTLEAFASGLSVIASDHVHVAKYFQKDDAVKIYPAQNGTDLEKLLCDVLAQPWEENQKQGRRARDIVEKTFLAEAVVPQIEKVLFSDLSNGRGDSHAKTLRRKGG